MQLKGTTDIIPLQSLGLDIGQEYTLVVTNTDQDVSLEFLHGDDMATWWTYPGLVGTQVGGVVVIEFRCVSGCMRVKLAAAPAEEVTVSAIPVSQASF